MKKIDNIKIDLELLDKYIENLEEQKKQLKKENLKKKLLIEELKKIKQEQTH